MREIVSPLLILPCTLHKLTLNALFAVGAPPSWSMCKYRALLFSRSILTSIGQPNWLCLLADYFGRAWFGQQWSVGALFKNVTKCLFFSRVNLDTMGLLNCSVRVWMSISTRYVTFHDLSQTILGL